MAHEVVIIGAGPYGLSAGVHLQEKGIDVRVFGEPMEFWGSKMPEGMLLRSPRIASNLSDPGNKFTLDAYEKASGLQPCAPVPLDTFVAYGRWFCQQLDGRLDRRTIAQVEQIGTEFRITLRDGEVLQSSFVVVAAGIGPFQRTPAIFAEFGPQYVSHCYEIRNVRRFTGKRVGVIGAGQSALESAALIHEAGAQVELIARISELRWIGMHKWLHELGPISSMLYSYHDIGPAGISRLVAAPHLVGMFPLRIRDKIRTRAVRPAGSAWLPARLGNVKRTTGRTIVSAKSVGNELQLTLSDGTERRFDHIVLGTGYDVDISRFPFLDARLLCGIQRLGGYPKLAGGFASSIEGLHFIGATAARSFGPLAYFVTGTKFASSELTSYISKNRRRKGVSVLEPVGEMVPR